MIDLQNESPLTLNQARRLPYLRGRNGNQTSLCTLNRWRTRGIGGIVLETVKVGGTVLTTAEAILRFVHSLNGGERKTSEITTSKSHNEIALAEKRLDRAGITDRGGDE